MFTEDKNREIISMKEDFSKSFGNVAKYDPFGYCICHDMTIILQQL